MKAKNTEQELRDDLFSAKKEIRTLKDYLSTFKTYIDVKKKYESEYEQFFGSCCSNCVDCGNINYMKKSEIKEKEIDLDLQSQNVIYLENRIKNIMEIITKPIKKKGK